MTMKIFTLNQNTQMVASRNIHIDSVTIDHGVMKFGKGLNILSDTVGTLYTLKSCVYKTRINIDGVIISTLNMTPMLYFHMDCNTNQHIMLVGLMSTENNSIIKFIDSHETILEYSDVLRLFIQVIPRMCKNVVYILKIQTLLKNMLLSCSIYPYNGNNGNNNNKC
jgi:hypothetical protein